MTSKEIDERIKKVQQQNDKLRNDISLFRSKLKNNQNVLRDLKAEKDKMYVKELMQTILKNGIESEQERKALLTEIENFAKQKKSSSDEKFEKDENQNKN